MTCDQPLVRIPEVSSIKKRIIKLKACILFCVLHASVTEICLYSFTLFYAFFFLLASAFYTIFTPLATFNA